MDGWPWGWMETCGGWMDGDMGVDGWMGGWIAMGMDAWPLGWVDRYGDGCVAMGTDARVAVGTATWIGQLRWGSRVGPGGRGHGDGGAVGSGRLRALSAPRGSRWTLKRSVPFRVPLSVYSRRAAASFAPPASSPRAAPLQATPLADVIAARQRPRAKDPFPARNRRHQKAPRPALSATDVIAARRIPVIPAQP